MFVPFRTIFFVGFLSGLVIAAGSGCQVLEFPTPEPTWKQEALGELGKSLDAMHWQPRMNWSPTREWETREAHRPAADSLRWRYASNSWKEVLAKTYDPAELSFPDIAGKDLLANLAERDDLPGWNAAILLAQRSPERALPFEPTLARLATQPAGTVSPAMQSAAAEAWCLVLAASKPDPIEALAPAGRALLDFDLPDAVRGELFRGIGRWVPPANVPGLDAALPANRGAVQNPPMVRQAALEACVLYALWNREASIHSEDHPETNSPWPATLLDWQWEPDAYFEADALMRRRFGYWLVLTRHPNAFQVLKSHLTDQEFSVRDDALIHLGWLKTPEALETLQKQARRPEPRVRAMAVKGLAHWGVKQLVPFLEDASPEVRRSVAEELGRFPVREAAMRLQDLQADVSPDVEQAALESARYWPDSLAIPVLLHGMEHASLQTRRECFRELRRRSGIEDSFPIAAGPEVRSAAVSELARDWNLPTQLDLTRISPPLEKKTDRLRVEELRRYLADLLNPEFPPNSARHQSALEVLKHSAPEDVPAIEEFVLEQPADAPTAVILRDVLPALSPAHRAIEAMRSENLQDRRRGANDLRTIAGGQSLSRLAIRSLGEVLKSESDGLVWRSALHAILPDDNPETARIAGWAANHPDAGIRQLACEFADRHRRPEFADWLLPLLHDPQKPVQLAAIEAAGRCGDRIVVDGTAGQNPGESLPGLRSLLTDRDSRVSRAAAIAMSRLGDPQGHDELLRLSRHPDDRVRLEVVAAMGTTRQTRFVETLIGLGWTARSEPVKREVLKSLKRLVPKENHPPALAKASGTDAKIQAWAEWFAKSRTPRAEKGEPGPAESGR